MLDVEQHTWAYDRDRNLYSKVIVDRVDTWIRSKAESSSSNELKKGKGRQTMGGEERLRWATDLVLFGTAGGSRGARDKRSSSPSSSSFALLLTSFFRFDRSSWSRRFRLLEPELGRQGNRSWFQRRRDRSTETNLLCLTSEAVCWSNHAIAIILVKIWPIHVLCLIIMNRERNERSLSMSTWRTRCIIRYRSTKRTKR